MNAIDLVRYDHTMVWLAYCHQILLQK